MKKNLKYVIALLILIIGAFIYDSVFFEEDIHDHEKEGINSHESIEYYTCSMHPEIKSETPGDCPKCGMDLVPVKKNAFNENENSINIYKTSLKTAGIEIGKVFEGKIESTIELNGRIEFAEDSISNISAWTSGRIEDVYIDETGSYVKKGERLFSVYSPEIIAAQNEFLQTLNNGMSKKTYSLKLKNLGLTEKQISDLADKKKVNDITDIYSPESGLVFAKNIFKGKYVKTGELLYSVADNSKLWAVFDVYEGDIESVGKDQIISVKIQNSDKEIDAKIDYVSDFIKSDSTADARVIISNDSKELRPGMFVKGNIKVLEENALLIPESAPLIAGKRSVVYKKAGEELFEMKEITLGKKRGNYYPVLAGLEKDDEIVLKGQFYIDSSAQINGRKSFIVALASNSKEEKEKKEKNNVNISKKEDVTKIVQLYLELHTSLSKDDMENSVVNAENLKKEMDIRKKGQFISLLEKIKNSKDIKSMRNEFFKFNEIFIPFVKENIFKIEDINIAFCPMVPDTENGGKWIQKGDDIRNPYFGKMMFRCGEILETLKSE